MLRSLFLASLTMSLWLGHIPATALQVKLGNVAVAQSPGASQLVQRGVELYQAGDISGAIAQWETALSSYRNTNNRSEVAIVLENLARAYQQIGQIERAINYWHQAIATYRQMGNRQQVGRMLVEQAQAYSSLGQHLRAIAILCNPSGSENICAKDSALQIARATKDRILEAAALGSLGNAYRFRGDYTQAINYLDASLKIAQEIDNSVYRASALNGLGNTYTNLALINYRRADLANSRGDSTEADKFSQQAVSNDIKALQYFEQSIATASDVQGKMRGLLNSIPAYYRTNAATLASEALKQALSLLEQLPDARDKVYAAIELAHLLQPVTLVKETSSNTRCLKPELQSQAQQLLQQAVLIAQRLKDRRSESFALGELGHAYECSKDFSRALDLTQQARWAADQDLLAKDSLYLWEWQAGRIFKAKSQEDHAIKAYQRAIATLESIRGDILIANRDVQFDFRDTVDPIYREFIELKLELASLSSTPADDKKKTLNTVLNTVDSLKLAELQDYFGSDCVLTALNQERVDLVGESTATAVFSSIILPDRTAIIVTLPNGEKRLAWINNDQESLRAEINNFRRGLERFFTQYNPQPAQKIYDWMIRPFTTDLEQAQIKTLVFIQDGILRSVPMAALHDGEKFLVQKYAIATTPTLTLTDPTTLNREKLRALALGLTKPATIEGREFPPLANVSVELSKVKTLIPGSKELLNDEFTRNRLQQELNQTVYPLIHIATHGEFGGDPENTFIVTGNNEKLTITELDRMLRNVSRRPEPVELLTLTACQTAAGDDRAALGLAGVAVQAGARSALASLWFIDDATTAQIATDFYTNLRDSSINKAEALRTAQVSLIEAGGKNAHPAYWAAFILIGNWL
ncbi:MAG TPA: hypothetical protein DD379_08140 [Cyanobacteria bacterium UBA11162]|nr:hypothetical protein [Cyanobacteria bacterium UBA11162]